MYATIVDMELEGDVIVTGGASGLGEATVRRLATRGAKVTIADINDGRAKDVVDELGGRAEFVHTDVTLEPDVQELVRVGAVRGPIRVVVNCAGYGVAKRRPSATAPHTTSRASSGR